MGWAAAFPRFPFARSDQPAARFASPYYILRVLDRHSHLKRLHLSYLVHDYTCQLRYSAVQYRTVGWSGGEWTAKMDFSGLARIPKRFTWVTRKYSNRWMQPQQSCKLRTRWRSKTYVRGVCHLYPLLCRLLYSLISRSTLLYRLIPRLSYVLDEVVLYYLYLRMHSDDCSLEQSL